MLISAIGPANSADGGTVLSLFFRCTVNTAHARSVRIGGNSRYRPQVKRHHGMGWEIAVGLSVFSRRPSRAAPDVPPATVCRRKDFMLVGCGRRTRIVLPRRGTPLGAARRYASWSAHASKCLRAHESVTVPPRPSVRRGTARQYCAGDPALLLTTRGDPR